MQLVAYGAQDIYLTGNPQMTFFKVVYRRHTNFAMESIQQVWDGDSTGTSGRCSATISRNGDLVHRLYLEINGETEVDNPCNKGSSSITSVEIEIGGQRIDKHTGHWMEVWAELTEPNPTGTTSIEHDVNASPGISSTLFQKFSGMGGVSGLADKSVIYFVPLQFWFCKNPGLALPLIALQYHEVKIILNHSIGYNFKNGVKNNLWSDYIYLDTDERRRFAQVSHEYLIEQVQYESISGGNMELNFNHPVKELIWTGNINNGSLGPVSTGTYQLKLNGNDRFVPRDYRYFTRVQVWQHHSGVGGLDSTLSTDGPGYFNDSIAVYSFALKPEEHQPSGTCNFSRIDNAKLIKIGGGTSPNPLIIFAVNYNVLRIMSGMAGLAYSN